MPRGRARLKDRRVLIRAVNQIVVDRVAAAVHDLGGLFRLADRSSVFDCGSENTEDFDRRLVELFPFRGRSFAERVGPVNLSAVAPIAAADFRNQAVAELEPPARLILRGHGKVRIAHGHAGHEMDAGVAARSQINRLDQRGDFVFAHAGLEAFGHRLHRLVGELRGEANALDLGLALDGPEHPELAAHLDELSLREAIAHFLILRVRNASDQPDPSLPEPAFLKKLDGAVARVRAGPADVLDDRQYARHRHVIVELH